MLKVPFWDSTGTRQPASGAEAQTAIEPHMPFGVAVAVGVGAVALGVSVGVGVGVGVGGGVCTSGIVVTSSLKSVFVTSPRCVGSGEVELVVRFPSAGSLSL